MKNVTSSDIYNEPVHFAHTCTYMYMEIKKFLYTLTLLKHSMEQAPSTIENLMSSHMHLVLLIFSFRPEHFEY